MNQPKPTYPHITSYKTLHAYLSEWLRRQQLEVDHIKQCNNHDELSDRLQQIRDDLLYLADQCLVIEQDVISGAISKEEAQA